MSNKNSGVVSIGVNLDYEKELNKMMSSFESKLKSINDSLGNIELSKDIKKQIADITSELEKVKRNMTLSFDQLSKGKLDSGALTHYKQEVTQTFNTIDTNIKELSGQISSLQGSFDGLNGKDFSSNLVRQYNDIKNNADAAVESIQKISEFVSMTSSIQNHSVVSEDELNKYNQLKSLLSELDNLSKTAKVDVFANEKDMKWGIQEYIDKIVKVVDLYDALNDRKNNLSEGTKEYDIIEQRMLKLQATAIGYEKALRSIYDYTSNPDSSKINIQFEDYELDAIEKVTETFSSNINAFKQKSKEYIATVNETKKASESIASINTFVVKDGAIHVPVELSTTNKGLQTQLRERIDELQSFATNNPIITPVKLRIDGKEKISKTTIKEAEEELRQLESVMTAGDASALLEKTMKSASALSLATVKAAQKQLEENKLQLKIDWDAFKESFDNHMVMFQSKSYLIKVNVDVPELINNISQSKSTIDGLLSNMSLEKVNAYGDELKKISSDLKVLAETKNIPVELSPEIKNFKEKADQLLSQVNDLKKAVELAPIKGQFTNTAKRLLKEMPELVKVVSLSVDQNELGNFLELRRQLSESINITLGIDKIVELSETLSKVSAQLSGLVETKRVPIDCIPNIDGFKESLAQMFSLLPSYLIKVHIDMPELITSLETAQRLINGSSQINFKINSEGIKEGAEALQSLAKSIDVIESSNITEVAQAIRAISNASKNIENIKLLSPALSSLSESLSLINTNINTNLPEFLKGLKVSSNAGKNISSLNTSLKDLITTLREGVSSNSEYFNTLQNILSNTEGLANLASILSHSVKEIKSAEKAINELSIVEEQSVSSAQNMFNGFGQNFANTFNGIGNNISGVSSDLKEFHDKLREAAELNGATITKKNVTSVFGSEGELKGYNTTLTLFNEKLKQTLKLKAYFDTQNKSMQILNISSVENIKAFNDSFSSLGDIIKNTGKFNSIKDVRDNLGSILSKGEIGKLISNPVLNKTGEITANVKTLNGELQKVKINLDPNGFARWASTGAQKVSLMNVAFGGLVKKLAQIFAYKFTATAIIGYFKQGLNILKEYDTALTTISYTMDIGDQQLKSLGENIVQMANDLNSSLTDAMAVAQIYANMNTSSQEIKELATPTIVLSNISGMGAETAADEIQAVVQQFDMLAEDSMHIVDVYDKISASVAVDYTKGIEGMAGAVKVAGASAKAAGLDFEQLSAIVAKTQETTRADGQQIGNALKTIFTRLSKASNLDDSIDNETLSKASQALHEIGIEVYKSTGEYREFDVIMSELAEKWDSLSDAEQANISFQVAATRQSNVLRSVLQNWTASMELATEATEANGNALKNQEKYEDSYAGRMQALSTAGQTFWLNLLNDDVVKDSITNLTKLLGIINKLVEKIDLIPATGIFLVLFGGTNVLKDTLKSATSISDFFSQLKTNAWDKSFVKAGYDAAKAYGAEAVAAEGAAVAQRDHSAAAFEAAINEELNTEQTVVNTGATEANTVANVKNAGSFVKLGVGIKAAWASMTLFSKAMLAAMVIYGIYKIIDHFTLSVNEASDAIAEASDKFEEETNKLASLRDRLDEVNDRINELVALKREAGSLSLADQNELDMLREESQELREQNLLQKQKTAETAKEDLATLEKTAGTTVYRYGVVADYGNSTNQVKLSHRYGDSTDGAIYNALEETMTLYNEYKDKLTSEEVDLLEKDIATYSDIIVQMYDSYKKIEDAGLEITGKDLEKYKRVKALRDEYLKYAYSLDKTKDAYLALSAAQKKQIVTQNLVDSGFENKFASDVANKLTPEQLDEAYDLDIPPIYTSKDAKDFLQEELDKASDWLSESLANGLLTEAEKTELSQKIANNTLGAIFGNVNMDDRYLIEWTDELKKKWAGALASWDYDPEVGMHDTVWGGSENFEGFEIAYTPILQTEDGAEFLSQGALYAYIQSVLKKAKENDGKITMDEILKWDAVGTGYEYGGQLVKGMISGITDPNGNNSGDYNATVISYLTHFAGEFGAINLLPQANDSADKFIEQWFKEANKEIKTKKLEAPEVVYGNVQSLGKGLDILSGVYEDVKDKGKFDYSSIFNNDDFNEAFSKYESQYRNFLTTIAESPDDIGKCQQAFDDLATAYINGSGALDNLTEDTKAATVAMLKQMGVSNAEEAVTRALEAQAKAEEFVAENSIKLKYATYEEIEAYKEKGVIAEEVAEKIKLMILQERLTNNALDSDKSVGELVELANQAGITSQKLIELFNIMTQITKLESFLSTHDLASTERNEVLTELNDLQKQVQNMQKEAKDDVDKKIKGKFTVSDLKFTGGSSTGKDSSSGSSAKDTAEEFDWIERAIEQLEKTISRLDNKASDTWRSWGERNQALSEELGKVTQEMNLQASAYETYMAKANAVPLSEYYKQLVRDGALVIEEIADESLKKLINEYKGLLMSSNHRLVIGV